MPPYLCALTSSFHIFIIYAQSKVLSFLSKNELLTKFPCKIQPLNVKLVIKIQMCWHGSPLRRSNSPPLSFWMGFISHLIVRTISQCAWISSFNYILKYYSYAQKHIDYLQIAWNLQRIHICSPQSNTTAYFPPNSSLDLSFNMCVSW